MRKLASLSFGLRVVGLIALGSLFGGLAACGDDSSSPSNAATDDSDAGPDDGSKGGGKPDSGGSKSDGGPSATTCPRSLAPADRARKAVVSHPFVEGGGAKANVFEVLDYSEEGTFSQPKQTFTMGPAYSEIVFTPDGKVGIVAQDDGTLGVFTFDDTGTVRVVHEAFKGQFYASRVVVAPDGTRVFVLDNQTAEHNGGVYEVAINCDGTLTDRGLVIPGGGAHVMAFLPNDPARAVLVAMKAFNSADNTYAHQVDFSAATPAVVSSGAVFPEKDAIASWVSITPDAKYAMITDNGVIHGSRMAAIELATMKAVTPIETLNPAAFVMSPWGNAGLVVNSDGEDALRVVTYDPSSASVPFKIKNEVAYAGAKTELPTIAQVLDRGKLKGRILVGELLAIRQLTFAADGSVTDKGTFPVGTGATAIVGAFGIQP
ncbi:hypothetical protein AKJ09_08505 [Labilithrix luteola]|uniref:Uncharacterized protein n=1 Tax=Labilithrix luteola TaxID=1391654 RepID=A0A0K1Q860_9BACT|nr:lactonase family protein [Labilithrix luteola]AKV01842.1 hypothetical protein AKJ09_08505 [Labilithrix luteola]